MGLYIVATPGQSKHEFVSSDALGADLLTEVLPTDIAIFVGPTTLANLNEIVTALEQCRNARREAGIVVSTLTVTRATASVVPGAGRAAVVVANDAVLLLETVVSVAYGDDFLDLPDHVDSSIFFTNAINQMSDVWMETVGKSS